MIKLKELFRVQPWRLGRASAAVPNARVTLTS
jgi:hypothetical protein